jgi:hypothetical protein
MFDFENEADAARAATLIKKAVAPVRKRYSTPQYDDVFGGVKRTWSR